MIFIIYQIIINYNHFLFLSNSLSSHFSIIFSWPNEKLASINLKSSFVLSSPNISFISIKILPFYLISAGFGFTISKKDSFLTTDYFFSSTLFSFFYSGISFFYSNFSFFSSSFSSFFSIGFSSYFSSIFCRGLLYASLEFLIQL